MIDKMKKLNEKLRKGLRGMISKKESIPSL